MFMFNTHVIYYFYVDHYNISSRHIISNIMQLLFFHFYTHDILIYV
jgi:hypothetical protein